MTWLHLATCVLVYSSMLLIFSGHLIRSILLRKFLCMTSIWSSRSCITVHSLLLYRNILPTYASSVLILILRVVLLSSSIYLSLLYVAFASCFLVLMCSVVLNIFAFSPVFFSIPFSTILFSLSFVDVQIVLLYLCCDICLQCVNVL